MQAYFIKRALQFKTPAGTSRGVLNEKPSWFLLLKDEANNKQGIGECSVIPDLSIDKEREIEPTLEQICLAINQGTPIKPREMAYSFPAIQFALETALIDYQNGGHRILFPSEFTSGQESIPINGLIWMGDAQHMRNQVNQKLEQGYGCIKLKIGAIDTDEELSIIHELRKTYPTSKLELRVDANGAFHYDEAREVMKELAVREVHSIEQPISSGHTEEMAKLSADSPLAVALDEELIGLREYRDKYQLIEAIKPQYLILKPSLLGGFNESREWIRIADDFETGWWVTSALESNIGLNALAQWTYSLNVDMPQGLGTGGLFRENIGSPLEIKDARLFYNPDTPWKEDFITTSTKDR